MISRMHSRRAIAVAAATLCVASSPGYLLAQDNGSAGVRAIPMPNDSRIVVFPFMPNNIYTILARPMAVTNVQLAPDEQLVTLAMGDTAQWLVSEVPGHVFFKPLFPDLSTSATLVTTKRSYQLNLRSSPEDGKFYQQVSWQVPNIVTYHNNLATTGSGGLVVATQPAVGGALQHNLQNQVTADRTVSKSVQLDDLNFAYTVTGDPSLTPTHVFDDGRFTWVRLDNVQEMPAVFMINAKGETELLNFVVKEPYIIIQRLVPGILLKQGRQEVRITKKGAVIESKRFVPFRFFGD